MRLLLFFLVGCDLERMKEQPNLRPYEASALFADGRAMRVPPEHTVPRPGTVDPIATGKPLGTASGQAPRLAPLGSPIGTGRSRFEIYCAVCHGLRGDGKSEVARKMELRRPPPLIGCSEALIARVVREGYGLMPSYAGELSADDQRAVVAYVRSLK